MKYLIVKTNKTLETLGLYSLEIVKDYFEDFIKFRSQVNKYILVIILDDDNNDYESKLYKEDIINELLEKYDNKLIITKKVNNIIKWFKLFEKIMSERQLHRRYYYNFEKEQIEIEFYNPYGKFTSF